VRIAKADLVPTDHNLRRSYRDFGELERACEAFCEKVIPSLPHGVRRSRSSARSTPAELASSHSSC
jgi:hypothetical protein